MRRVNVDRMRRYRERTRTVTPATILRDTVSRYIEPLPLRGDPTVTVAPPRDGSGWSPHYTLLADGTLLDHTPYLRKHGGNA